MLLTFLCEQEIAGKGSEITEPLIAVRVPGRAAGFSPLEDSSVRTRTYELRQRLIKLLAIELPDEAVRIVLPKGTYLPRFEPQPPKEGGEPQFSAPEKLVASAVPEHSWVRSLLIGFSVGTMFSVEKEGDFMRGRKRMVDRDARPRPLMPPTASNKNSRRDQNRRGLLP